MIMKRSREKEKVIKELAYVNVEPSGSEILRAS